MFHFSVINLEYASILFNPKNNKSLMIKYEIRKQKNLQKRNKRKANNWRNMRYVSTVFLSGTHREPITFRKNIKNNDKHEILCS